MVGGLYGVLWESLLYDVIIEDGEKTHEQKEAT